MVTGGTTTGGAEDVVGAGATAEGPTAATVVVGTVADGVCAPDALSTAQPVAPTSTTVATPTTRPAIVT